jgi:hypothetical protein
MARIAMIAGIAGFRASRWCLAPFWQPQGPVGF